MWHGLRVPFLLCTLALLILPLSASSALPVGIGIAVTIAGAAWTGLNLLVVGARSAAIARADEIWVSDPPSIAPDEIGQENLERDATQWNTGRASAVSIAPAVAPSGNAITIKAETNWEQTSFTFSPTINVTAFNLANPDGVLWGEGFAFGTLEGIVTKEFGPWGTQDKSGAPIAEIPLRYAISDMSLSYEENLNGVSLDLTFHAWKLDDQDTEPEASSWHEQLLLASVSLDGPSLEYLQVEGDLDENDFMDLSSDDRTRANLQLQETIEREIILRVPFPDDADRVVLAFGVEVKGRFQIGKR
jgi:hypothetical protein